MLQKILKKIFSVIIIMNLILINYNVNVEAKEQINFKNITIEQGLTQGTVETLFQDSKGYIWIGTNDGLNRYNGYKFKVYRLDENKDTSIVNSYILDIKEDQKGNIWVATASGLSKISKNGYNITNYTDNERNGNLSHRNINSILVTKDNKVLVATSNGMNIYNPQLDNFERIFYGDELSTQYINSLAEDNEGNIWLGTERGVNKIDRSTGEVTKFLHSDDTNSISENDVYKVYYDEKGYIWVGTYSKGACKINIKTNKVTRYYYDGKEDGLGGEYVKNFLRDSSGNFWIATNGGLSKYDEKNDSFITYKNKLYDKDSLVNDNIYSLIEDRTGLIWIGTYAGISIFNPNIEIQHFKSDPLDNSTISSNIVSALYEDKDGAIWIGNRNDGIDILNRDTDRVINISSSSYEESIPNDDIFDIKGDGNNIFIATSSGVSIIDKESKVIKNYDEDDGLSNKVVKKLFYDDLGYLWIGTTNGLFILNLETNEVIDVSYILEKYSPEDKYIGEIYKDKYGEYWIGTFVQGGLLRINPINNIVTVYKNQEDDDNSISNNSIRCVQEGDFGEIWIGTSFGLNKFNRENETFERYTTRNGMANNTIYGILIDSYGNPWCSTNMGISKLNLRDDLITNLDVTDGLQGNEFNGNAYFKNSNGEFLFGGINGFNILNPKNVKECEYISNIVFNVFKVNGVEVENLDYAKLQSFENNIYIESFVPIYKNINNIQYYYLLEGAAGEWTLMDSNSITLSNLSPGKYTFKIRARSNNGTLSDEASVNFIIKPPFWASKSAFIVYIICIFIFIIHNKYKMKKLDQMVSLRTKELSEEMERNTELFDKVIKLERSKNNYLINLSHELRTPLNVIYSTEQLIRELNKGEYGIDKSNIDKYMIIIRNNTKRLLKIINDLIDTSKIEHGSYRMDIKEVDIVYVVEEAALSLREYIESKGITLIIDPEIEEKMIEADANEIERCIVNIVNNAYKFTQSGGYIKVDIKDLEDGVRIEISDNGVGIDKENYEVIFNRFNQIVDPHSEVKKGSGLGLTITKKIIDLHQGKIYVKSEKGKGSKFVIILPNKQKRQ